MLELPPDIPRNAPIPAQFLNDIKNAVLRNVSGDGRITVNHTGQSLTIGLTSETKTNPIYAEITALGTGENAGFHSVKFVQPDGQGGFVDRVPAFTAEFAARERNGRLIAPGTRVTLVPAGYKAPEDPQQGVEPPPLEPVYVFDADPVIRARVTRFVPGNGGMIEASEERADGNRLWLESPDPLNPLEFPAIRPSVNASYAIPNSIIEVWPELAGSQVIYRTPGIEGSLPVSFRLELVSGGPGTPTAPPTYRYRIRSSEPGASVVFSESAALEGLGYVRPIPNGIDVPATTAIGFVLDNSISILWCNEGFSGTTECE